LAEAAPAAAPALGDAAVCPRPRRRRRSAWRPALLFALLGGAMLNLMPCVFPVLSLKVFGFAATCAGPSRHCCRRPGLHRRRGAVLRRAGRLLLVLRAGGEQLGWGFQLQSPAFVAALAALFTLIGLNLAGVFEFGSVLPARWSAARARHPLVDSLLTGVLAVAVASPCTAPFMGASLGLAVTMPAARGPGHLRALGLGMAAALPGRQHLAGPGPHLPRPGPWMAHFKVLMAFPMFATVVWLVWVLGQQTGIDGAAALLGALLALAFLAWALGSPTLGARGARRLRRRRRWRAGRGGAGGRCHRSSRWRPPPRRLRRPATLAAWSPERVAELRAAGRPVFVDFTAAWCVTCQYNKRTTLADAEVMADFRGAQRGLLRADWTRRDAAHHRRTGRAWAAPACRSMRCMPLALQGRRLLSEILSKAEVTGRPGRFTLTSRSTLDEAMDRRHARWPAAAASALACRHRRPARAGLHRHRRRRASRCRWPTSRAGTWCWSGSTPAAPTCRSTTAPATCRPRRRRP
jgi:thiol:disulfide interchange protein